MLAFLSKFKQIDRFGQQIEIHYKGKTSYQTICGAIATLFVYSLILVNTINISLDFINNDNQKENVRTSIENIEDQGTQYLADNKFDILIVKGRKAPSPAIGTIKFY